MNLPLKPSRYVAVGAKLYEVRTREQREAARDALGEVGAKCSRIKHWNGREWVSTPFTLYARGESPPTPPEELRRGYLGPPPDVDGAKVYAKRRGGKSSA